MGSGELTGTMVEVHKQLLERYQPQKRAVFLDTPAGFQLNVDQLSQKAAAYFNDHVLQPMTIASFKSKAESTPYDAEKAYRTLRETDFVLIGPGSPTYAVRNWLQTPIPGLLAGCIEKGGCLVAASAAALTVGRVCLPVYEIYKVGEALHWVEGINVLAHFGFSLAVIPHWNNAEGGTHDTRFCYMGEARFRKLESLLPDGVSVLGLDEHTACLLDFETGEAVIKGIGQVALRRQGTEITFHKGERFPIDILRGEKAHEGWKSVAMPAIPVEAGSESEPRSFWDRIHTLETAFRGSLEIYDPKATTSHLLELDRTIWRAQQNLESEEFISQAREIFREMIVLLGVTLESSQTNKSAFLDPLMVKLLELRERFRQGEKWEEADAIRETLRQADIMVEDTRDGSRWRLGG
jgi:peptidase E